MEPDESQRSGPTADEGNSCRCRDARKGSTMSPYLMEKIVEHNQAELARARQKREWRKLLRLDAA